MENSVENSLKTCGKVENSISAQNLGCGKVENYVENSLKS
nr:MAG TPA: hypothetical protein [Caudoviricetes sp.]